MKNIIGICFVLLVTIGYSQTKKEKKAKVTSLTTGMYDGTESDKANDLYNQADKKVQAEDYKGAIKLYKAALKEDPNFVEVYDNLGLCYRRLGDFKNAIANYNKSIEIYPKGTMAHQNLGVIYGIQKEYEKAISEYEKVQEINPDDPEGYYGTINNYLGLGKYEEAIKNATKTVEIYEATESPYLSEAHYLLGLCYYFNKDRDNARTYLGKARQAGFQVPQKLVEEMNLR